LTGESELCHCQSIRTDKTLSITSPPDLLLKAQQLADREQSTISELFGEALRRDLGRILNGTTYSSALVR
jgi:hypothetical protein